MHPRANFAFLSGRRDRFNLEHRLPSAPDDARPAVSASPKRLGRRIGVIAAGVLGAAALAAFTTSFLTPPPRSPGVVHLPWPLGPDDVLTGTALPVVAISHDGTQLAYVANNRLFLKTMAESTARPITADAGNRSIYHPVFSPDGTSLAYFEGIYPTSGTIKTIPVGGGVATTIAPAAFLLGMAWPPNGILFSELDKGISLVSPNGGVPEIVVKQNPGDAFQHPSMLPDGKTVLFTAATRSAGGPVSMNDWRSGRVVARSLKSGKEKVLLERASHATFVPSGHLIYASEGVLYAVAFDASRLEMIGKAAPVIEGVQRHDAAPSTGTAHYTVSDTGTLVYVPGPVSVSSAAQQLVVIGRDGRAEPLRLPTAAYIGPRLSPHGGSRLAFGIDDGKQADVYVYEMSGASAVRQLTFGGKSRYPLWFPDSERIAFQSTAEKAAGIYWQRADGTNGPQRLTTAEPGTVHVPETFSPDRKWLVFTALKDSAFTLHVLSLADGTVAPFKGVTSLTAPAASFSPDGHWIAYAMRTETNADPALYVEPFPQTGSKYLITSAGFRPYWSEDGTELFFGTRGRSWVVTVSTAPSFTFGNPVQMPFRRYPPIYVGEREYDLMPGGQRFIFAMPAAIDPSGALGSATQRSLQVIVNWFEDVKRRAPRTN